MTATAVKLASLVLPMVTFTFVRNPALAILLEGLVTFAIIGAFGMRRDRLLAPKALGLSLGWRVLYLGTLLLLGLKGGILAKGTTAIIEFLFLESALNGILIWLVVSSRFVERLLPGEGRTMRLPAAGVAAACAVALGAELLFSVV